AVEVNGERTLALTDIPEQAAREVIQKKMAATSKNITALQNGIGERIQSPEAVALYQKVLQARKNYTGQRATAIENQKNGKTEQANQFFKQDMPGLIAAYQGSIDTLYTFQQNYQHQLYAQAQATSQRMLVLMGFITALALVCAAL